MDAWITVGVTKGKAGELTQIWRTNDRGHEVLAAEGYPEAPAGGASLRGADPAGRDDDGPLLCFHAGTRAVEGGYQATGGRVATFVGLGDGLAAAREVAHRAVGEAMVEGAQHRTEIALREVEA